VDLLVFDELHKMKKWKNYLKGVYDTKPPHLQILVTGSARLETFRQAGDSLAGRFFAHRLMPFSLSELRKCGSEIGLPDLMERGGFPEPLLAEDSIEADRWRLQYIDGLIRTDILDFENIHDFKAIQTVFSLLRKRVGSPVSYASIAGDVGISPTTVKKYIGIFEALYILFRVIPFSRNIARSLLKEPKIYFFDNGLVDGDEGKKFENLVAISLLKHIMGSRDYLGKDRSLHYLRTKDGHEIDFCLTEKEKVTQILEVKVSDSNPGKQLHYFHKKYNIPATHLVFELKRERRLGEIDICRADRYLSQLML